MTEKTKRTRTRTILDDVKAYRAKHAELSARVARHQAAGRKAGGDLNALDDATPEAVITLARQVAEAELPAGAPLNDEAYGEASDGD